MKWLYNMKISTKVILSFIIVALISGFIGASIVIDIEKIKINNAAIVNKNILLVSIILIMSVVIAIVFGVIMSKIISNPIIKLKDAADKLSAGDINVRIESNTKDEIGDLANSFNEMAETIKEQVKVAEKIAAGDFSETLNVKSENDVLSKNLNLVINNFKLLVSDTNVLVQAVIEGRLSDRGDSTKFNGGYKKIIEGINNALDAIAKPLNVTSQYISKMANGEDLEVIENCYDGDFGILINNLNLVRECLYTLLGETLNLTKEAAGGNLLARGDINKLKGGYLEIVKGINSTLDAVIEPLNEADGVLHRMAVNDLTTKMNGQYNGMLKNFAESINNVHTRLVSIQEVFADMAKGDLGLLGKYGKIGKRSENDKMLPAMIVAMTSIKDLIDEVGKLSNFAINGELSTRGNAEKFEGGYKEIIEGMNNTIDSIVKPIQEASVVLQEMAKGNLTIAVNGDYKGEHAKIKDNLNFAISSFNDILNDINSSAQQVAAGARQVSDGSQGLSQGSTEQASSIEELSSSIAQISAQT
ncbi:HAMP domain-containing protein, partial [Clostridium sp. PL3]